MILGVIWGSFLGHFFFYEPQNGPALSVAVARAIMDSLSGAGRAAVLAPAGNQGNAPQDGGFAIVTMNIALAIHTLFAQAMLYPFLSIFNIASSATKTN